MHEINASLVFDFLFNECSGTVDLINISKIFTATRDTKDANKKPFFLPHILIILEANGAQRAIPKSIKVNGTVASETLFIICDVIIPLKRTTIIGGNPDTVEDMQMIIKFLFNIT